MGGRGDRETSANRCRAQNRGKRTRVFLPSRESDSVDDHTIHTQRTRLTKKGKKGNVRTNLVARVRVAGMGGTNATALEASKAPTVRDRRMSLL